MSSSCSKLLYPLKPSGIKLLTHVLRCLKKQSCYQPETFSNPHNVCAYLQLHLVEKYKEDFAVLFLDNHHRLLKFEKLFSEININEPIVYSQIVVQKALEYNAEKVILARNPLFDNCDPDQRDHKIAHDLQRMLSIVGITVLDYMIVSGEDAYSFASHGLI